MQHKLLAFDLDGTLVTSDHSLLPSTHSALRQAQTEGRIIALASGRPTMGIAPIADALGLHETGGYVLSYNGAEIIDWKTKETLFKQSLTLDLVERCYAHAQAADIPILTYRNAKIISESEMNEWIETECRINGMAFERVEHFLEAVAQLPTLPTKCLMAAAPERIAAVAEPIAADLKGQMEAFRSAPFFLELVPLHVDKAQSLSRLLAHLGLTAQELAAFGDGYNDLSMLRYAGLSIAMANAVDALKDVADHITLSNNDNGIAHALSHFLR